MHHGVGTSYGAVLLNAHEGTHEIEDKVEHGLEVALRLVRQAVAYAGETSIGTVHCPVDVAVVEQFEEVANETVVVERHGREVVGRKTLDHSDFHLTVGVSQSVALHHWVVLLYREVAALVEQGQGRGHLLWRHVEVVNLARLLFDVHNVHMEFLHCFYEISWRA